MLNRQKMKNTYLTRLSKKVQTLNHNFFPINEIMWIISCFNMILKVLGVKWWLKMKDLLDNC